MPEVPRVLRGGTRRAVRAATAPAVEPRLRRLESAGLTWLHCEGPTAADVQALASEYGFHALDVEDVLSRSQQRAKIDEYDDYTFIVLHVPLYHKDDERLVPVELNCFVADGLLITIPEQPLKPLARLWEGCAGNESLRADAMGKGAGHLLYRVVDAIYDECLPILDKIGFKLDALEDAIFEGQRETVVRDLSTVTHEIITFRRIIKPQRGTLRSLDRATGRFSSEDLEIFFDDVVDTSERIWEGLESYKEVVDALTATNDSVISHGLNRVIRNLTVLSSLMLPLTLVTGFYGQNVDDLPLAHKGIWSVLFTLALMLGLAVGLLAWFRHRRWL